MKMLVTAIAIAAAAPVAAQTIVPAHAGHDTPVPDRSGKGCYCCDSQAADKTDAHKKMDCCEKASSDAPAAQHSDHNH